ncbi:hypothetical protein vseg_010677 [Gypsophila vaccaria]
MKAAQGHQKSYADSRRLDIQFQVGNKVLLHVSCMKGVIRFRKQGKLSPRYVGPYKILDWVGEVAYRLAQPPVLGRVHDVFHVSRLRKYLSDRSHVLDPEVVQPDASLAYEVVALQVLDRKTRKRRNGKTALVKVLWSNNNTEEATWEVKSLMR